MICTLSVFTVVQSGEDWWVVLDDHGEERHWTTYLSSALEWGAVLLRQDYEHSCPVCRGEARPVGDDPDYEPDFYPACAVCGASLPEGGWTDYHPGGGSTSYCWCCGLRRGFPKARDPRS